MSEKNKVTKFRGVRMSTLDEPSIWPWFSQKYYWESSKVPCLYSDGFIREVAEDFQKKFISKWRQ